MPLVTSTYKAYGLFKNGHFSTIYSARLRSKPTLIQQRERLFLPDGDFMDLDLSIKTDHRKIAILLHGLEGNAQRTYIKGQGRVLFPQGWDICAANFRGCSGEDNRFYHSYNAGSSGDLHYIVDYLLEKDRYDTIALIGFSLGGNVLLKYLGEGRPIPREVKCAAAISTPLSLKGSLERLVEAQNWVYRTTFLNYLRKKYRMKMSKYPEKMSAEQLKEIKTLLDFDHLYTAPAHGYSDAWEYYEKNSSLQFLNGIQIPTLLLNARNDTFLSRDCYPVAQAEQSGCIHLEIPPHGGHVGFFRTSGVYYSEQRTLEFLEVKN